MLHTFLSILALRILFQIKYPKVMVSLSFNFVPFLLESISILWGGIFLVTPGIERTKLPPALLFQSESFSNLRYPCTRPPSPWSSRGHHSAVSDQGFPLKLSKICCLSVSELLEFVFYFSSMEQVPRLQDYGRRICPPWPKVTRVHNM